MDHTPQSGRGPGRVEEKKRIKLTYLDPESPLTLREGVREARLAEGDEDAAQSVADEIVDDVDAHDAIHVLFGCPTDLRGEIVAHVWALLGTTMTLRDMHRVNEHEDHRKALAAIGHRRLLGVWLRSAPAIVSTGFRALRMTRPWPAAEFQSYLDQPLSSLRQSFGIRLSKGNGDQ